jgi:hypothetical protein
MKTLIIILIVGGILALFICLVNYKVHENEPESYHDESNDNDYEFWNRDEDTRK